MKFSFGSITVLWPVIDSIYILLDITDMAALRAASTGLCLDKDSSLELVWLIRQAWFLMISLLYYDSINLNGFLSPFLLAFLEILDFKTVVDLLISSTWCSFLWPTCSVPSLSIFSKELKQVGFGLVFASFIPGSLSICNISRLCSCSFFISSVLFSWTGFCVSNCMGTSISHNLSILIFLFCCYKSSPMSILYSDELI